MSRTMTSLRARLLVLLLSVVAAVWSLALVGAWFEAHHELDELFDRRLQESARMLLELDLEDLDPGPPQRGEEIGDDGTARRRAPPDELDEHSLPDRVEYQVWRRDGSLLLRSAHAPAIPFDASGGHRAFEMDSGHWQSYAHWDTDHGVQVRVFDDEGMRRVLTGEIISRIALPLGLALPLLAALIWVAVSRALLPLDRLSRDVTTRDAGHLAPLPETSIPDEARPLIRALNALLQRLAHSLAAEKRFTADAAHELRTPLAAIRAQAQVARASEDPAGRAHALDGIIEGADRATRLAVQLLTLSRAEQDSSPPATPVDLGELARACVAGRAGNALGHRQQLALHREGNTLVAGDADLLEALCGNLIDNAIAYAGEGCRIEVEVRADQDTVRLQVKDDGVGVDPAHRDRLLDRFYRAPGNRATGSGLGLAISRQIAQRHGATLALTTGLDTRGFGVQVDFPALRS